MAAQKGSLLFILALLTLTRAQECNIPGQCINSNILTITAANSVQKCQSDCQLLSNCHWFSYSDNFCQLFSDCNSVSSDACQECITSEVTCEAEVQCNLNGFCQGNLTNAFQYGTHRQCWLSCSTSNQCAWYSYRQSDERCFHFSSCDSLDEELEGFNSGQAKCTFPLDNLTKLLVVTGDPKDSSVLAEVLDFSGDNLKCQSLGNYPDKVSWSTGGLLNDKHPLVCGGYASDDCYVVGQGSEVVANMIKYKTYTASAVVNNSVLWITGGFDGAFRSISTEFIQLDNKASSSERGPNLPMPLLGHCLVPISQTKYLIIGGDTGSNDSPTTFLYDFAGMDKSSWKTLPNMKTPRSEHACSTFMHQGQLMVAVSGGTNAGLKLDTTEIFNPQTLTWSEGPKLPARLSSAQMVTNPGGNGVLVIGGKTSTYQDVIYELVCLNSENDNDCMWTRLDKTLEVARSAFVSMWIPDDLVECS